jgi:hypothetical protein
LPYVLRPYETAGQGHAAHTGTPSALPSDLIRELGDPSAFSERDGIERAVRELGKGGLLFRCEGTVLPTSAALRVFDLLDG